MTNYDDDKYFENGDKKHIHTIDLTLDIESRYEKKPTEKEFLEGLLKLLKHLTAHPNQIYNSDERTVIGSDDIPLKRSKEDYSKPNSDPKDDKGLDMPF